MALLKRGASENLGGASIVERLFLYLVVVWARREEKCSS